MLLFGLPEDSHVVTVRAVFQRAPNKRTHNKPKTQPHWSFQADPHRPNARLARIPHAALQNAHAEAPHIYNRNVNKDVSMVRRLAFPAPPSPPNGMV